MSVYDAVKAIVVIILIVVLIRFGITAWRRQRWGGLALTIGVWLASGIVIGMLTGLVPLRLVWLADIGGPLAVAAGIAYWRRQIVRKEREAA